MKEEKLPHCLPHILKKDWPPSRLPSVRRVAVTRSCHPYCTSIPTSIPLSRCHVIEPPQCSTGMDLWQEGGDPVPLVHKKDCTSVTVPMLINAHFRWPLQRKGGVLFANIGQKRPKYHDQKTTYHRCTPPRYTKQMERWGQCERDTGGVALRLEWLWTADSMLVAPNASPRGPRKKFVSTQNGDSVGIRQLRTKQSNFGISCGDRKYPKMAGNWGKIQPPPPWFYFPILWLHWQSTLNHSDPGH